MEKALAVAKTLMEIYQERFSENIDEMKTHKLMYFLQRESLIQTDTVLFEEPFYGWKFGPVLLSVRNEFSKNIPFQNVEASENTQTRALINHVLDQFGGMTPWRLSIKLHEEFSWKLSREGLESSDNGHVKIRIEAIRIDAFNEQRKRRKKVKGDEQYGKNTRCCKTVYSFFQ